MTLVGSARAVTRAAGGLAFVADAERRRPARRTRALRPRGLDPRVAWTVLTVDAIVAVAVAAGLENAALSALVITSTTAAVAIGIRLNRPQMSWPFWGFVLAGIFWMFAAAAREATGATGNLTSSRSLLPDVFALPGYAAYGVGLVAMIRARDGRNRGSLVDAVVVGIGGFLLAWEFLISRTLTTSGVSTVAQMSIVMYPVLDCAFVALASRLAFTSGRRLAVHWLLLAAMIGLLVSDVLYVADELGIHHVGARRDLGYLVAAAAMAAAGLHPSMRDLHRPDPARRRALPTGRAILLALSLLLPAGLFIYGIDHASVRAVPFQAGVVALAIIATFRLLDSVREQNVAADALSWQAGHDGLTGLPNRNAITDHLDAHLRERSTDRIIAYFDLDNFKNINDALGHIHGDELLMSVAGRLRDRLPSHVVLGRIGGDEFVAICDSRECTPEGLARRIKAALATPFTVGGFEALTTASIGITVARGERDAAAILRDADTAMYRAKEAGRNTYAVFSDEMRTQVERRIRQERELREALDRGGDLRAWFQPVHDFTADRIIGFEALARWWTPDGMVPPCEFIQVAEDTGLITRVGAEILDQACAAIAAIRARSGRNLFVTVNVSARQLVDDSIIEMVRDTLARHDLPGDALCLEITESIMVNDQNVERLRALCGLGVWLAVDDFGTGYSSLSYLRRMPVSKVKIDKSFVDDIAHGDPSLMIAILSMAHSLQLTCIAEGVETAEQAERLHQLGCDAAQGYLWAKPMPFDEVVRLVDPPAAPVTARPILAV